MKISVSAKQFCVFFIVIEIHCPCEKTQDISYRYGNISNGEMPDQIYGVTWNGTERVNYTYDGFGRLTNKQIKPSATTALNNTYTYEDVENTNKTTTLVKSVETAAGTYTYTYDAVGNITSINDGTYTMSYVYDSLNQLVRENDQKANKTTTYTYINGNITERNEYEYTTGALGAVLDTKTWQYGDSTWGDLLINYNGNPITYDEIGNPLTIGNKTLSWDGRQLRHVVDGNNTYDYQYNADGQRVSKTVNGLKTEFVYNGSILAGQKCGNDTIIFMYDNNGDIFGFTYNGTDYYYIKNAQNDVIAIADTTGAIVVNYNYDAWGKINSITGSLASTIGELNPIRYRSYFYDSEINMYYLNSRYYSPDLCRFLNADSVISATGESVQGYNPFAYCFNNPVNMSDETGHWPSWAKKLVAAVAVVAVVAAVAAITVATAGAGTAIAAIAVGAAKGAAIGCAIGAATGAAGGAISHRIRTGSWKGAGGAALNGMGNGALTGAISGAITGGITGGLNYNSATTAGKGFDSFRQLKNEIGSPGAGNEWHHIVEQSQISKSGFSTQLIQNTNNIVSVGKTTHRAISGYYSSIQPFTNGQIVRNWIAGQSFESQYQFGINVINLFS